MINNNNSLLHKPIQCYIYYQLETCQSYNLVNRQCAQVVQRALEAGGIKTTKLEYLYFDDSTHTEADPYIPLSTFSAIRNNYLNGKIFKRKIK